MNIEDIKQQKLIFTYEGDYILSFVDENKKCHKESDTYSSSYVDLYCLVQSCFEAPNESIFTCSCCGDPICAGIYNFSSWLTETEIFWHVNDDYYRFDRKQYIEEVKAKIDFLINANPDYNFLYEELFGTPISKETLLELKNALDHYEELNSKDFPRHKVILYPFENKIYINEKGKRIGFKNKDYLPFRGKDILGGNFFYECNIPGLKKWASKINNKSTIDWAKWNSEGIKFAQQIRKELPPFFDIWYRFQEEDKEDLHILVQENENNEND